MARSAAATTHRPQIHPDLATHLREAGVDAHGLPSEGAWRLFLGFVNEDYEQADRDRMVAAQAGGRRRRRRDERAAAGGSHIDRMADAAPVGIFHVGADGVVIELNHAFATLVDRPAARVVGLDVHELVAPGDRERLRSLVMACLRGGDVDARTPLRWLRRDGREFVGEVTMRACHDRTGSTVVAVVEDATERLSLEVELRQAQKLEAIGRLAAGIAHEINTPIQHVGGSIEFLRDACGQLVAYIEAADAAVADPGTSTADVAARMATARDELDLGFFVEEAVGAAAGALEGVERVAEIVRAVKGFGHLDSQRVDADLNDAIRHTVTVARGTTKQVADVRCELGALPTISCVVSDLNQVFLNLLVNATDAIADKVGDGDRGTITIRSRHDDGIVTVEVEDDGDGIPDDVLTRIFDPFFTTKAPGKGTGQGLALVRTVVEDQHQGVVSVDSRPGVGTRFLLSIPVTPDSER